MPSIRKTPPCLPITTDLPFLIWKKILLNKIKHIVDMVMAKAQNNILHLTELFVFS